MDWLDLTVQAGASTHQEVPNAHLGIRQCSVYSAMTVMTPRDGRLQRQTHHFTASQQLSCLQHIVTSWTCQQGPPDAHPQAQPPCGRKEE